VGAPLHFGILGPLEVQRARTGVSIGGPRQRALLALLLCNANHVVSRDRLIDELLSDRSTAAADGMLRVQISRLRKALSDNDDDEPRVIFRPPGYLLVVHDTELDLHTFEQLVREGRQAVERGDPSQAATLLREAERLWRGPPLADLEFEPFARVEVQRLEDLRLSAIEERIDADLALGRHAALCPELEALAAEHPLRERLHAHLMLALYRSGRQAEALDAYQRAHARLSEELGLEPGLPLRTLQRAILTQDPSLTGPSRPSRGNLPAEVDAFIGREHELALLRDWIGRLGVRLTTLTGPGGSGKSRLAFEAGRELALRFPDGVYVVELAPLRDPALVVHSIARTLGVPDTAESLIDSVIARLSSSRTLLILDNFEHVTGAALYLARLLAGCADLFVLATSRVPLHLRGEHELAVAPLEVESASRLFADRARQVRPEFRLSDSNALAVGEICDRLDGLPLAIELAAARVRSLPLQAMLPRLERRLDLLTDGPVDLPDRHRTLRDTIAWSHELLDDRERSLLRRLAVFRGGCSVAAAEAVCALGAATREALELLVEHGLLKVTPAATSDLRFELLETVREFAHERLSASGELERLERAHARFFVSLAQELGPGLRTNEEQTAATFEQLTLETDNFRAVHEWSLGHDMADAGMLVIGSLWLWYWTWLGEASDWTKRLLALPSAAKESIARAAGLFAGEVFSWALGDLVETKRFGELAVKTSRRIAEPSLLACSLAVLSSTEVGNPDRGYSFLAEAELAAQRTEDDWIIAVVGAIHALFAILVGDPIRARRQGEKAAALFEEIDAPRQLLLARLAIGFSHLQLGELDRSREILDETLPELMRIQNWKMGDMCAIGLALNARLTGDTQRARHFYEQALSIAQLAGDPSNISVCLEGIAASIAQEDPEQAARLLGAARAAVDAGRTPTVPGFQPLFEQTSEQLSAALGDEFETLLNQPITLPSTPAPGAE
jgi:predicted ATPase/DNA-binding SARP family transcriptional activator